MGQLTLSCDIDAGLACAEAFLRIAEPLVSRIGEDVGEGTQPHPFPPSVGDLVVTATNLAFAIELYIKAILVLSQVDVPRGREGHYLGKLYSLMPQHFKVIIERF